MLARILVVVFLVLSSTVEDNEPTFLEKPLSDWIDMLHKGKDIKARKRGVIGVEQIGVAASKKVMPALVQAFREDKEPEVRIAAGRAAGRAAAKALEDARAAKKDDLPRFEFLREALSTALRTDKTETVREAAALALGDLGSDARAEVGALSFALKDKHAGTSKAAAQALRRMGRDARDAQLELQALLADKKAEVEARSDAAVCLGQIRPDVTQAIPVMREVLMDEKADVRVRKAVADALGRIGRDAADTSTNLATLMLAKETPIDLRLAAVTAIDQFGPDAKPAIPSLAKALGDAALLKSMGDNARFFRCLAMHSLGRMGKDLDKARKDVIEVLVKAIDDSSVEVSVTAIETLGALGSEHLGGQAEEIVERLNRLLLREGRKSIREAAEATREKLRSKKK
jgi:HEAT repeat protein